MENMQKNIKVIWWIKSLLASYIVTGISLLVLTFFMYKFELNEKIVSAAIVGIYVVSTLIGGMIIGKLTKSKRYFLESYILYCFCSLHLEFTEL